MMTWYRTGILALVLMSHPVWSGDLVKIPAGEFRHPVVLDREVQIELVEAFVIDRHPVSRRAFAEFVVRDGRWQRANIPGLYHDGGYLKDWAANLDSGANPNAPVTHVSWYAARAYCQARGGYLPRLVQWEYLLYQIRQHNEIPDDDYARAVFAWYGEQHSGMFADNHFKTTGMVGLVNEWLEDYQLLLSNGEKIDFGGGSCGDTARLMAKYDVAHYATFLRYQSRSNYSPGTTTSNLGFRCAYPLE